MSETSHIPKLNFEILLDGELASLCNMSDVKKPEKETIISLINDFEEGKWRSNQFDRYIWNNICLTALTYEERQSLISEPHTRLERSAKNLRLIEKEDKGEGAELSEIFLYGIMASHYGALPVVPKIFYKQNRKDYAKGADSVHIILDDSELGFSIWLGEAKLYSSFENKDFSKIIKSINEGLKEEKLKKENSIILSLPELGKYVKNEELIKKIRSMLHDNTSIDNLKPHLHIPILVIYECSITKEQTILSEEYKRQIKEYHLDSAKSFFDKQRNELSKVHLFEEISFHIILFPIPDKSKVVEKFIKGVKYYRGED